ncbi:MAG TPA: septum formation initiator family protein [Amaricoccus sp.]|uniref:FtsB family cell division protein n=1 Tax=Amaricoccus sp. TaxID=1872485 RepID=UPI002C51DD30|nr:septum formation initiator family protein [Amaricoccus sp.]HMQ94846.1 septum formation initiator family protein [Amaricoccus sp.]HMR54799.1 septum formation initiator family protein [Amaricoccus sp.]HMR61806.1 septum formation initiator family protein [Amaricoccus sp.]HMU01809.1 septum formation initiator family protein [Amaricoccus sp.]
MHNQSEPAHRRFGGALFATALIATMGYLSFAALQGEHGLFRLFQIEAQEAKLRSELAALKSERAAIENKTRRLSDRSLDLDLLDEQARKVLSLARTDEILIP